MKTIIRNKNHLEWIRSLGCFVCGFESEAHHVRHGSNGGMGLKPGDDWTIPLCHAHHMELHSKGWKTFEAIYNVDMHSKAKDLAKKSPYLVA